MTTTLLAAEQEFARQLGDLWSSTTTGAGAATSLVDSALMGKANDWITDESWAFLIEEPSSSAAIYDERKISSLDNTTGTLTTLTFAAAPGTGIDYQVHRLFSPSEYRRALVAACRRAFPYIYEPVWDESLVSGNWLKDGSFERWTTSTNLTDWTETTLTATQTSTSPYYKHGTYSCKLDTAAGTLSQAITNNDDLKRLVGKNVKFSVEGWCNTASALRISINDGVTQTYSEYHEGDSAWTYSPQNDDALWVEQDIDENATQITFTIHMSSAAATAYVDDARVISGENSRLYIGHLGLAQNQPHQVFVERSYYATAEPWIRIHGADFDSENGYLYLPESVPSDRRLRIKGIGYLDFLASGVSSTDWTATVNINQPQLEILVAQAALYLYTELALPNFTSGTREEYQKAMNFWAGSFAEKTSKFSMPTPRATVRWT